MKTQAAGQPFKLQGTPFQGFSFQNLGDLEKGEKAVSSFDYDPATFPKGTVFKESWPGRFAYGVRGWAAVNWYRYYGTGTQAPAPFDSVQVNRIKTLLLDYDAKIEGNGNMLLDWFLTAEPNDMTKVVAEIEVLPNPSPSGLAWARQGLTVGTVGPWTVTRHVAGHANIFFFVPTNGVRNKGQIDLRATMLWLAEKTRLLTGQEWLNGIGFGLEPVSGKSSMTIKDMRVDYARKA